MGRSTVIRIKANWTPSATRVANMFPDVPVTIGKVGRMSLEAVLAFDPNDLEGFAKAQKAAQDFKKQLFDDGTVHDFTQRVTTIGEERPLFTVGDDDTGET